MSGGGGGGGGYAGVGPGFSCGFVPGLEASTLVRACSRSSPQPPAPARPHPAPALARSHSVSACAQLGSRRVACGSSRSRGLV